MGSGDQGQQHQGRVNEGVTGFNPTIPAAAGGRPGRGRRMRREAEALRDGGECRGSETQGHTVRQWSRPGTTRLFGASIRPGTAILPCRSG
jgi:hypothetical protein